MRPGQEGRALALLLMLALGLGLGYLIFGPAQESIDRAAGKQHVAVEVRASDETSATFTVQKLGGAPDKLTLAIPAGMPIRNADRGGQWLVTAQKVVIRLAGGVTEATQKVETYCLHQFAKPPTLESALSIAALSAGGRSSVEETEPVRKLADCLARQPDDRDNRQLAVWMVADGWTDKSYAEVREQLRSRFREQIRPRMRSDMSGEIRKKLQQQWPDLTEQRLREEIAYYERNTLGRRIAEKIEENTTEELKGFVQRAKPLLERCGHKTSEMRFFASTPAGG